MSSQPCERCGKYNCKHLSTPPQLDRIEQMLEFLISKEKERAVLDYCAPMLSITKRIYVEIFMDYPNKELSAPFIQEVLKERGLDVKTTTHHANLSKYTVDKRTPIERVCKGIYKFKQTKE